MANQIGEYKCACGKKKNLIRHKGIYGNIYFLCHVCTLLQNKLNKELAKIGL